MLRVRPILHTPHAPEWVALLTALGLGEIRVADNGLGTALGVAGGRCFAADAGRILVSESDTFGTRLGFEVRDVQKFAQWTISDGTPVLLGTEAAAGGSVTIAEIVAPDGVSFSARPVDPLITDGTPQAPDPHPHGLAVVACWGTPDVPGAISTLANTGAKPEAANGGPGRARYRAKHGGYVDVTENDVPEAGLSFEYTGSASAMEERLALAGYESSVLEQGPNTVLSVRHPDGGRLRVACTQAKGNSVAGEPVGT
ncbi:hypothetical protein [Paeniglutamicibacter kerguelensis]|uniref:VOC family protein n=1 Tax=Paeniglutamicibacter kerguelensis TaxID=254788 RepID=A0ABS4XJE9_9MICC|nr:hypothetical protein [Paeniglutamicibacter kerguelensis]MBP2388533.1 hypothetical protein [Paeniglutamicibacter kerguelensis]